ncbi:DUF5996 family protein [Gymnodinialimonas hymeniacidonis]|uniref:DUF5996 family protein n=1 Tax=Gymnodinialimonas hymeniacidonis TaxID=3126508 RepID=UPI0034C695B5
MRTTNNNWPDIPYDSWRDTSDLLHRCCQIVGKYRLAHAPWINHAWHATLYVTPRGLSTGPIPDGTRCHTLSFDFCDHKMEALSDDGARKQFALKDMSVADFYRQTKDLIESMGGEFDIHGAPNELDDATPFAVDTTTRPYDADAAARFHGALCQIDRVFSHFRTGFLGKVSPSHLFWGSFDLATTRFSGRSAPLHPAGIPNLPDEVAREAYSHEVSSAGFWPGGGGVNEAMFYSYAYPTPDRFADQKIKPAEAWFDRRLGEFLLPYAAVSDSDDPDATLLEFLKTTYEAAANSGKWDRAALECDLGKPGFPRAIERS